MSPNAVSAPVAAGEVNAPSLSWLQRGRIQTAARIDGRFRDSRLLWELVAAGLVAKAQLPFIGTEEKLATLLTACRRTENPAIRKRLSSMLRPYLSGDAANVWREKRIGWDRYFGDFASLHERKAFSKTLVLKAPGADGEKGVIYAPFEYNLMRVSACYDARAILSEYLIVGASSWSPTDYAPIAALAGTSKDPVFLGISNFADAGGYDVMRPVVRPLAVLASDLIDPNFFQPKAHKDREIDILMVANWMRFKRHWLLFEALRGMRRNLRVVLVGRNAPGRTERELRAEAKAFGAPQDIEYLTNIPIAEVVDLQCNARVSAVFSRREGSCLAVTESFFADTPVAMMQDAHVGSKAYINAETGVLLSGRNMSREFSQFLEASDSYRPREWAVGKIDCYSTSERINATLRAYSQEAQLPWTTDIVPFCRRYVPEYADPQDEARMQPALDQLRERHGVELQKFVYRP